MSSRSIDAPAGPADTIGSAGNYLRRAALYAVAVAIILLPALWNGFPFVFADTGGYLIRPFVHDLDLGRSALYGAFLAAGIATNFWFSVAIQALLCAWLLKLVLRTERMGGPAIWIAVVVALCALTSLPWYAGQLEPDVFMPLAVLAFYLIAFASPQLRKWEIAALAALIAFSIAAHMSVYAVLLLLFALCVMLRIAAVRLSLPRPRLMLPVFSLVLGTALALASNYAIAGVAAFTPGGSIFLFGRLLQSGYVKAYLDRRCPDPSLSLCNYRDALPAISGDWLWDTEHSPLAKLGGWRAFAPEASRINSAIIREQPVNQIGTVLKETAAQLATVATGEGIDATNNWYTLWVFQLHAPGAVQQFSASRQQHNAFDFWLINIVHVPLAIGATLSLPILVLLCWRRHPETAMLAFILFAALVGNAAVCAAFSVVDDRYQSRIAPIAVLGAIIGCYRLLRSSRSVAG